MPEANISMVVLHALAQQLSTIFRLQLVRLTIWVGCIVVALPTLVVGEPGFFVVDAASVRPTVELHLHQA